MLKKLCDKTVANPDLELREGGGGGSGLDLLAMAAIFLSVISPFFTQNKRGVRAPRAPPLDPPLQESINLKFISGRRKMVQ